MKILELKCFPEFFCPIFSGLKTFELCYDNRHYEVGDILRLREFDGLRYTGFCSDVVVTYVLRNFIGLAPGYVCLGIKRIEEVLSKDKVTAFYREHGIP